MILGGKVGETWNRKKEEIKGVKARELKDQGVGILKVSKG